MKECTDFLLQFGNLNPKQIGTTIDKATEPELRKGEHFWEAGKISKYVGFITDGLLRVYYYNDKGEEITS